MDIIMPQHTRSLYEDLDPDAVCNADLALMQASVILKRESCKNCGMPFWIGHNTDNYIEFKIEEETCWACSKVDKANKDAKDDGVATTRYPVLEMLFDKERPSRASWYESMRDSDG